MKRRQCRSGTLCRFQLSDSHLYKVGIENLIQMKIITEEEPSIDPRSITAKTLIIVVTRVMIVLLFVDSSFVTSAFHKL